MFEYKTGDFDNHTGAQALNSFCQEAFDVTPGILNAMKRAFDMFTNAIEQTVKFRRVLEGLISALGRPDTIAGALTDVSLPVVTQKAFVTKDVAVADPLQNDLSHLALVRIGSNQVIHYRQDIQRRQHHQLIAKVVELASCTVSIASTPSKGTVRLRA